MPGREVPLARLAGAVTASVVGDPDVRVTGVTTDSRLVSPGDAFLCIPGLTVDGHDFAPAAVAAGAVAVVADRPVDVAVPVLVVESVRAVAGPLAAEFFDHPSRSITVVGVTGTNGKTTVTHLVAAAAGAGGLSSGVSGTLSGPRTTPEAVEVQRTLAGERDAGVDLVAMEVSSHALDQRRVDGTRFAVAVFTNLTPEHLDYHASMDEYEAAKARLFEPTMSAHAVVNVDDAAGRRIAAGASVPCVEVSPAGVTDVVATARSTTFSWRGRELRIPLGGAFMVEDALLAAEAAVVAGVDPVDVARGLETIGPVPGRFEVVPGGADAPLVIVDYAHTPDALATTLGSARAVAPGRVTVVFGCGGDRDALKRPLMGAIAGQGADRVIVTNDNPRDEDPAAIAAQVLDGVDPTAAAHVETVLDRRNAIAIAVSDSGPGDVVVVAGKGHETTQEIGGVLEPFDDRAVVREILGGGGRRR